MRDLKFSAAAEQAITQPQRKTFVARYLATGNFWRRRFVGYSPTKTPMYKIVPSQLVQDQHMFEARHLQANL
jgi:hypothetical protein